MKINDTIKNAAGLGIEKQGVEKSGVDKANVAKVETGVKPQTEKSQSSGKTAENVTLSPLSSQLQKLEANVASSSVFDAQKVDAIKSAIAGGQFKVSSEKVADGLIESVKDLLTNRIA